jgi:hypothetical protein
VRRALGGEGAFHLGEQGQQQEFTGLEQQPNGQWR